MINGTRLAWKGIKAFARASARNNVFTAQYTRGGGNASGMDGLMSEVRSEAAYGLGYAMGMRKRRRIERAGVKLQADIEQAFEIGGLRRAAFIVLQFESRWNQDVDLRAWPELANMCEVVAREVLARRG